MTKMEDYYHNGNGFLTILKIDEISVVPSRVWPSSAPAYIVIKALQDRIWAPTTFTPQYSEGTF